MATCNIQTLMTDGRCYADLDGPGQWETVKLSLLCQILQALDPMATCNVQELMSSGKCFFPVVNSGQGEALELQLLCEIMSALGGSGIGTDYNLEFANVAALPAAPADTTKVWAAWFRDGSPSMHWSPTLGAWV